MDNSSDKPMNFRDLPSLERWCATLSWLYARRKRKIMLTLVFKLKIHSRKQERNLLKCFWYVTNLTHRVLEALREESSKERPDGAFALVLEMLQQRSVKGDKASDRSTTLGNLIGKYFNRNHLTSDDYYFSVIPREGVYREVARAILNWCSPFLEMVTSAGDDVDGLEQVTGAEKAAQPNSIPSLIDLYQAWHAYHSIYEAACKTPIPFGPHKGKQLKSVGRRELFWLLDRLPPEDVVRETLHHLEVLIGIRPARDAEESEQAALAEHPWRRELKHERAIRERRINTRAYDPQGERVLLESLSETEKDRLYDELLEMQQLHDEYAEIRQAIETVLFKRPPRFPSVAAVSLLDDEEAEQDKRRDYWATLDWFRSPFPQRPTKSLDEYSMEELEELEADARTRMLRAHSALDLPRYQPLSFKRSMRPKADGHYDSFGFLRDATTEDCLLALVLSGRKSLQHASKQITQSDSEWNAHKGLERFAPQVGENLQFFNFLVPFRPHETASIMLFSLEYDAEYHGAKYLKPLYERILATSVDTPPLHDDNNSVESEESNSVNQLEHDTNPLLGSLSAVCEGQSDQQKQRKRVTRALIGSARVTCRWTKPGKSAFFLHLPVPVFESAPPSVPETVLGIHEHRYGYSYAVISFSDDVIETGDLEIDPSVLPRIGDRIFNPNYANEVAVAILELAKRHRAYIGIESTAQFRQTTVSRTRNRRLFGRPSRRIATIVRYKALEYGLLPPRMVWKVAPSRDCSQCGNRLDEGHFGIRRVMYVVCPTCELHQPLQKDDMHVQTCIGCGGLWRAHEAWIEQEFVCACCHASPLLARINTAIVVALKTIHGAVEFFELIEQQERGNEVVSEV